MSDRAARFKNWLIDAALPLWAGQGVGPDGGFIEQFDLDGRPEPDVIRRIRVQARQIYTYAHASDLGLGDWRPLVLRGVDWLTAQGWDTEQGGFFHRIDPANGPADRLKDTYDHAFVLYGLAWAFKATGDSGVRTWIDKTVDYLDTRLRDPGGRGYLEGIGADGPRRQNPHMHLLEASIALYDATGDKAFLDRANTLSTLFHEIFFDPTSGTLTEFFDRDWRVADGDLGRIVEPGHHFEWVFLLKSLADRTGASLPEEADRLFETARAAGLDAGTGLAVDEIWRGGGVKKATKRCWPQTEAIRAHIIMADTKTGDAASPQDWIDRLFRYYLDPAPRGAWLDVMGPDGAPAPKAIPASTFYHLFTAYAAADAAGI